MKQASDALAWTALDDFTTAYLECALWSSMDWDHEGECLDERYGIEDVSQEGLRQAVEDCDDFRALCDSEGVSMEDWSDEQAGHDFWLTRNGHGAGFWDRGLPAGDALSDLAKTYGGCNPYAGADGLIYL